MHHRKLIVSLAVCLSSAPVFAQGWLDWGSEDFGPFEFRTGRERKIALDYDLGFIYNFDNREFDSGDEAFVNSSTINGMRLTPAIGVRFDQNKTFTHRLLVGADAVHDMGDNLKGKDGAAFAFRSRTRAELNVYYALTARFPRTEINAYAGMFPRTLTHGSYSQSFLSDSYRFYDSTLEGLLFQVRRPRSFYELGFDWMGQIGHNRREEFMVYSYGESAVKRWLGLGWTASLHHYANAIEYTGVVDNNLLSPFIRFDLGYLAGIQEISAKLSYLQALQNDRKTGSGYSCPAGGELKLRIMNWNVGIENSLYIGQNLMPLYYAEDHDGIPYSTGLYHGSPFYQVHANPNTKWSESGLYDRAEIFWQPHIADFIDLRLSCVFHFTSGLSSVKGGRFEGTQQKASLLFDLGRIMGKRSSLRFENNGSSISYGGEERRDRSRSGSRKNSRARNSDGTIIWQYN